MAVSVREVTSAAEIVEAAHLFDVAPTSRRAAAFVRAPGHHLLIADVEGRPAGFVSGVEMRHPDKDVEIFVYELGVDEEFRRQGVASALLDMLAQLAEQVGAQTLWVITEPDNTAAQATYARTGAERDETVTYVWSTRDD